MNLDSEKEHYKKSGVCLRIAIFAWHGIGERKQKGKKQEIETKKGPSVVETCVW